MGFAKLATAIAATALIATTAQAEVISVDSVLSIEGVNGSCSQFSNNSTAWICNGEPVIIDLGKLAIPEGRITAVSFDSFVLEGTFRRNEDGDLLPAGFSMNLPYSNVQGTIGPSYWMDGSLPSTFSAVISGDKAEQVSTEFAGNGIFMVATVFNFIGAPYLPQSEMSFTVAASPYFIDGITLNVRVLVDNSPTSPVNEPSSNAMLLLGLAVVGGAASLRHRR